jgi:hypothetical protein
MKLSDVLGGTVAVLAVGSVVAIAVFGHRPGGFTLRNEPVNSWNSDTQSGYLNYAEVVPEGEGQFYSRILQTRAGARYRTMTDLRVGCVYAEIRVAYGKVKAMRSSNEQCLRRD